MSLPDLPAIRARFPSLASDHVFLENAGGSQVPRGVADAIRDYMLETYVQLGAGYPLSSRADDVVARAHALADVMVNAGDSGTCALGPSSSQLTAMLADCYARTVSAGDNVVIAVSGHEANIGPWARLERQGVEIRWWSCGDAAETSPLETLDGLLDDRTRIVACTHVSNLLGEIVDVGEVSRRAHAVGARVVVDGVAYAPHRAVDVTDGDVDWYTFSTYKVYGPHMAVLYGRHDAFAELEGPNHYFVPRDDVPYKFELGGVSHEGCAGWLAVGEYLQFLAGAEEGGECDRATVEAAFDRMTELELPVQERLVSYLRGKDGVRIVGPDHGSPARVPTVSFLREGMDPRAITAAVHEHGVGMRHGHMYAKRLCEALAIESDPGVVRISAVHYNGVDDVERLIAALETVL